MRFRHLLGLLIIILALSACATQAPTTTTAPAAPVKTAEQVVTETIEATATTAPAETVAATAVAVVDECLACHTDKEQLISTADPVETGAESESKGVG